VSTLESATSRANGAKSHGPVTPEGKALSAQNASTHGIFKSPFGIRNEQDALFLQLEAEFIEEWDPQGPTETALVDQLVICRWRLRRTGPQIQSHRRSLPHRYRLEASLGRLELPEPAAALRHQPVAPVRLRQLKRDRAPQPQPDQPDTKKLQNEPEPATAENAELQNEPKRTQRRTGAHKRKSAERTQARHPAPGRPQHRRRPSPPLVPRLRVPKRALTRRGKPNDTCHS
jgi:hypothetical protein